MGGRGAKLTRKDELQQLINKSKRLSDQMENLSKEYGQFVDRPGEEGERRRKGHDKWLSLFAQNREIRRKINAELNKRDAVERQRESKVEKRNPETFVNGYGEATHREITSSTYKKAQTRLEREVRHFIGDGLS